MKDREDIIRNYIEGYCDFDVSKMVTDFSDDIVFENIQHGQITMTLTGIEEFRAQAEESNSYFSERIQEIKSFIHEEEKTEIEIDYFAVLAIDFPNGMKKGQKINLKGRSIFEFQNNKITKLSDLS